MVLLLATAVGYFMRRTRLPGRVLLEGAAMYTVLVPSVAFLTAVMWAWIGSWTGLYGGLLLIAMTQAARSLPIATRNIGDGFGQIDRSLEEAARVCGAGRWQVAGAVTMPLLQPVLLATFTLVFLSALRDLNTPLFLGGGSARSMALSVLIFQLWSENAGGRGGGSDHGAARTDAGNLHPVLARLSARLLRNAMQPLEGFRVLDLTHVLAGPCAPIACDGWEPT